MRPAALRRRLLGDIGQIILGVFGLSSPAVFIIDIDPRVSASFAGVAFTDLRSITYEGKKT